MIGSAHTRPESSLERYEAIAAHAELELELAGRGELGDLGELAKRWSALVAGLPAVPPRGAGAILHRAQLMHERTRIELLRCRELLLAEMDSLALARRAAEGYRPAAGARPRIDASA